MPTATCCPILCPSRLPPTGLGGQGGPEVLFWPWNNWPKIKVLCDFELQFSASVLCNVNDVAHLTGISRESEMVHGKRS